MKLLFENWRQYLKESNVADLMPKSSELYGNCGMLAVALLEEGIRRGKEVEVVFLSEADDPIDEEDYDLYHVAIYYNGKYYDDRGEVSREELGDFMSMEEGEDYNLDSYVVINEEGLSTVLNKIELLTNWSKTCKEYKQRAVKFWDEIEKKKNEGRGDPAELKKDIDGYLNTGPQKGGSPYKNVEKHLKGKKKKSEISAPPGAPGGGSIGHGSLEEAFEKEEMSMYPWLEKIAGKSRSEVEEILKSEFKYIGGGSFRNVYSPRGDDDIVIKFVYDDNWYSRNDYMNKKEVEISSAYPRLFPKTFAHSPDFSWIAMERIEPVGDADEASFKKVIENFPKILNYIKNEMPFNIKEKFLEDLESYEGIWWFILQSLMYGGAYRQSKYKTQYSKKLSDRYQEYDIAEREYRVFYRKLFEYGMKNEKLYFMIFKAYNELELDIMDWVGGNIGLNANNELKIIDASYFAN